MSENLQKDNKKENVSVVMKDLEQKINPSSIRDGIIQLDNAIKTNDPNILLENMKTGAKEFEDRVGRRMTYSEMRQMWG